MDLDGNENSAIVSNPKSRIHKSISLDPDLAGVAQTYFGIDLTAIASASDEDLAVYADRARAAKELQEILPILKKHFSQLIEAQTDYEQFLSDVQKEVASAAKRIDKNILDAWLVSQGYQDHVRLMGQKAHNGRLLQEGERRSAFNLENLDFNVALQLVARRQQMRIKEINDKIPQAERREQMAQQLKDKRQQRKDLLTYGTAGNPQEKGFWESIRDTANLEKLKRQSELELQTFTQQATLQAAEAAYAILEPYEQPLLEGIDSLDPGTKLSAGEPPSQPPAVESVKVTTEVKSEYGCQLFDWHQFKTHPDDFAHIRIIGKTGGGKTMLADWLLDVLEGQQFIVTIKRKPKNWRGLKVYGLTRDYEACRQQLKWVLDEMDCRFGLIEKGVEPEMVNFVVDEWRSISQNCKTIKHKDEAGEEVIQLGAKDMMKEIVTLARDARLRMIALAQGEQVKTWGLEDESDLGDCFATIRIGEFATDYAKTRRGHYRKDSEDYAAWTAILAELKQQGNRCCMVEDTPARIPDLSNWQRESSEPNWLERTREQLEIYLNLEGINPTPSQPDQDSCEQEHLAKEVLSNWFPGKGWVKVGEARSMCKELRKLTRDAEQVKALILELVREESAEFDSAKNEFFIP